MECFKKGGIYLNNVKEVIKNNYELENREGPIKKIIQIEFKTKEQLKLDKIDKEKFTKIEKPKVMEFKKQDDFYIQNKINLQKITDELNMEKNKCNQYLSDLENIQNRQNKELIDTYNKAKKETLINLLKVIDELERTKKNIHHIQNTNDLQDIIQYNIKGFYDFLNKEKVRPMNSKGKLFDPKYHQAGQVVKSSLYEKKTVLEEVVKGYFFKDEVLREAIVKVAMSDSGK
jgi:molecular chaperone GrpE